MKRTVDTPRLAANSPSGAAPARTRAARSGPSGRITWTWLAGLFALLLSAATATAGSFGPPTFVVSSLPGTSFSITPQGPMDEVQFTGAARQAGGTAQIPEARTVVTEHSASVQGGFTDVGTVNTYQMEGTPSALEGKVLNHAASNGSGEGAFVNTAVIVEQWYTLKALSGGPTSGPVNLRMDVAFQGTLTGTGPSSSSAGPRAFFNGHVDLIPQAGATGEGVPLGIDAHRNLPGDQTGYPNNPKTVPEIGSFSDIAINEIVRSNAFQVDVGVPFGVKLVLSAAATTGGENGTADSNFFDPELATSGLFPGISQLTPDGFGVDTGGGNVETLAAAGFALQPFVVPEPTALTLFSLGLVGLGIAGRRRLWGRRA